jgi:TPR repeat protein
MKKITAFLLMTALVLGTFTQPLFAELGAGKGRPSAQGMVKKGRAALKAGKLTAAYEWFLKAAKKEDRDGENMVGKCYEMGIGITRSEMEAATWYQKSAAQHWADGENNLANCYMHGIGVRPDTPLALKYYHQAATDGSAAAAYNLAYSYENGFGLPKNMDAALHFYKMAAKKKYSLAQNRLRQLEK